MKISGIIMASGSSKRMGENKLKMKYKGKRIFEYSVDLLSSLDFEEKLVITNDEEIKEYSKSKGLEVVENKKAEIGKSESIKIGVNNTNSENPIIFFVADQPMLTRETVLKIIHKYEENKSLITYPYYVDKKGSPVIFPPSFRIKLKMLKDDQGGNILINENNSQRVEIDREKEQEDIDTKEDYMRIINYER